MPKWKDISQKLSKLSPEEEKKREGAFEAALLAQLANEPGGKEAKPVQPKPEPPTPAQPAQAAKQPPKPTTPPAASPAEFESIYISVTEHGKTFAYSSLAEVPLHVRQKIVNSWLATPPS